jgi:LacI family transcriptional regulator
MRQRAQRFLQSVTLEDVAARCGVSYQTVSRVTNGSPHVADKTRTKVLQAIAELGYRPNLVARRLATRRSTVIGMIGSHITYYGPAQVMVSVEEAAKRRGYNLMFAGIERVGEAELAAAIDDLCAHQIDGLILGVRIAGKSDFIRKRCGGMPFVALDAGSGPDVSAVTIDQRYGSRLVTRHLITLGHKRIAGIAGPEEWLAARQRRQSWEQAIKQAGLAPGPCVEGDWSAESGYAAAARLLESSHRFTAIVAANDQMALGALRALHAKGIKVPEEISVAGYDDIPESQFFEPPLTTIRNDFARQGELSVEVLLRLVNRETVAPALHLLRPELVPRESTATARKMNRGGTEGN